MNSFMMNSLSDLSGGHVDGMLMYQEGKEAHGTTRLSVPRGLGDVEAG